MSFLTIPNSKLRYINKQFRDQNKELLLSLNNQIIAVIKSNYQEDNKIAEEL